MRVFISHPLDDEDLANKLKEILENEDKIEIAYVAQKIKDYQIDSYRII